MSRYRRNLITFVAMRFHSVGAAVSARISCSLCDAAGNFVLKLAHDYDPETLLGVWLMGGRVPGWHGRVAGRRGRGEKAYVAALEAIKMQNSQNSAKNPSATKADGLFVRSVNEEVDSDDN